GSRDVTFNYTARVDKAALYASGTEHDVTQLLTSIDIHAPYPTNTAKAWSYSLNYTPGIGLHHALLTSVQKCGASGTCAASKIFTYAPPALVMGTDPATLVTTPPNGQLADSLMLNGKPLAIDLNGDGVDELLIDYVLHWEGGS